MKGKLFKTGTEYLLRDINGNTVAITNGSTEGRKLSKQNCDEIFGVVDIEKLALEKASVFGGVVNKPETLTDEQIGYMHGFIEAMALNKDKLFTSSDMLSAYVQGTNDGAQFEGLMDYDNEDNEDAFSFAEEVELEFRQSLQPLNEIDVEVEMRWVPKSTYCTSCGSGGKYMETPCDHKNDCEHWSPNFDSKGCLILKKIVL
jgi:hypothetical protein